MATKYSPSYLLFGFQPKIPATFLVEDDVISRKELKEYNSAEVNELTEKFEGMRIAAHVMLMNSINFRIQHVTPIDLWIGIQPFGPDIGEM